ncbi:multiple sugar transport system substrate-binding protein [Caldalkalibacillus uzonensis]|uniref:Multiple sugar transport system substrate-binding protein n=1 Tax=Caldalkalibacillus uzonensis TaxID=353224 RepID=A0ABU0CR68_9BACI|nr:extracellular solute-binding protein [Caldalkalibacillus uzonensis]MDQ0338568.1 multiple sugar transport system substrate-binding protein [Caldalkalibacillus uzonensis]
MSRMSRSTFQARMNAFVEELRNEIITGKRAPGEFLPSELELSKQFRLSKNSVRKGLDILLAEGLITKKPRVGTIVSQPSVKQITTITFGYHPSVEKEAQLEQLISDFEAAYPNIRVQTVSSMPYYGNYHQTVAAYMENKLLDVVTVNYTNYRDLIDHNVIDLLEEVTAHEETYPFLNDTFTHNGKQYVQPLIFSPVILCYNKKHFREAGLMEPDSSWTWEKVIQASSILMKQHGNKRIGFYFHPLSLNRWPVFLLQSGHAFETDDKGRIKICNTPVVKSIEVYKELLQSQIIKANYLSETDADAEKLFAMEKVSMIMTTYFSLNHLQDVSFDYDIAPLPYLYEPSTLLLVIGLGINKYSAHKEAAKTFVNYMISRQTQLKIKQNTLSIPANKIAAESTQSNVYRPFRYYLFREIFPTFRKYTDLNVGTKDLEIIRSELQLYLAGMEDINDICQKLEDLFRSPSVSLIKVKS